jgi:hypothetical protein
MSGRTMSFQEAIRNTSYDSINDRVQYKLMQDLKDEKLNINEYREISRGLSTIFNYLENKEK